MKKHTICLHVSPDLEALFMAYLVLRKADVREMLDIVDEPAVKFIPAGPLRCDDWSDGLRGSSPEELEDKGYLFLDCGGGTLDQHGKPWLAGQLASIDLLVQHATLAAVGAHLAPIIKVISDNDLTGRAVVKDGGMKSSSTPNTPRHLRNVIIGWNRLMPDRPQDVLELAAVAFAAIDRLVLSRTAQLMAKAGATYERVQQRIKVGQYFLAEAICEETLRMMPSKDAIAFHDRILDALNVMQADWERAIADYDSPETVVRTVRTVRKEGGVTLSGELVVAEGVSDTVRFGQVTRRNTDKGPYANITVQFHHDGRFMISSDGRDLTDVAAALRKADFARRGIRCTDPELLARPGHVSVECEGGTAQALYFAEFRKAVGNVFRANPHEPVSPLTRDEVMAAVMEGLGAVQQLRHGPSSIGVKVLDRSAATEISARIRG